MKLFLIDDDKINRFKLPETVNESFLFSYTSKYTNIEVFFNIYSSNGNWYLKLNNNFLIQNASSDTLLESNKRYLIKVKGVLKEISLYTYSDYNDNYRDISFENIDSLIIGNAGANIITDIPGIIMLKKESNGVLVGYSDDLDVCVNDKKVKSGCFIHVGDVIFVNNVRIIYLGTFLRIFLISSISIGNGITEIPNTKIDNSKYLDYNMKENDISLFSEDDCFFHKPRLTISYDDEKVSIDPPTQEEYKEPIPFIFSLGTGGTMLFTSIITMYRGISNYNANKTTKSEFIITLVSAGVMIIFSFLLPRLLTKYNSKMAKKRDKIREVKYTDYLNKKASEISNIIKYETDVLYKNSPSSKECYERIIGVKDNIWGKEIKDDDFLTIRVGLGNIKSSIEVNAPENKFTLKEDKLIIKAQDVVSSSKMLLNVPVTVSLCKDYISALIYSGNNYEDYVNGIILQILYSHNPESLKIVLLTDEDKMRNWDYLRMVPHLKENTVRYFASNEEEAKSILNTLNNIYEEKKLYIESHKDDINNEINKDNLYINFNTYYLIITDNYKKYKDIEFIKKLINFNTNIGFSLFMIDKNLKNVPNQCNKYTCVNGNESCILEKTYNKSNQLNFNPETFYGYDLYRVTRELSNIPLQEKNIENSFPSVVPFLEMFNVGNIDQLNILNRWNSSNPILTLSCPVGIRESGDLFKLDLHEKASGPHGLIAGSTGSGKSEFIITYILSMCVNYHPDEVKFVLIDYKGGGLAGAFENVSAGIRIPHLAGIITNLDTSEMNRTIVSIESEIKRRQRIFNKVREKIGESTIDIYKYQKYYRQGLIDEPIAHLFIITDEFAELKAQQPEFMDELISISRIGRSLGIHLILATQKPSGVVNDQIWSNSRFKVCLKVQTTSDSNEMLKRPEAASIKETGRFYLQVGYNEIFELGQSAWSGAKYIPSDKLVKKVDDSISFIDNIGNVIKSNNNIYIKTSNTVDLGDQLTNIVKHISNIALNNKIVSRKLWLDAIPKEIYLQNIFNKYNYKSSPYIIDAVIGEYDDPENQKQDIYKINLNDTGNTLIYGMPGSGKENLLTTFITSICLQHVTSEVNFYIIDFGSETLIKFKNFPQVGDVALSSDTDKIDRLYTILLNEISKRKKLFSDYLGTYNSYIKNSNNKLPMIICIIHGYESFVENMAMLSDKFIALFKDGPKLGINFVITNALSTGIRSKVIQLFSNKLTLRLNEDEDYRYVIDAPKKLVPAPFFGRGIAKLDKPYEFQTAYVTKVDDITKTLSNIATILTNAKIPKAPSVPTLPKFVTVDRFLNKQYTLDSIPVGISVYSLKAANYDFTRNFTPILSTDVTEKINFIYGLIEILKQVSNIKIRVIDVLKIYKNSQGVDVFNNDFDTLIKQIKIEALNDSDLKRTNVFIIIGLGAFKNNVSSQTQKTFNYVFEKVNEYKNNKFIIFDDYNSFKSLETELWYNKNITSNYGIWLGKNVENQFAIKVPNLSYDDKKINIDCVGFVVENSSHSVIKYIVDKEVDI